MFGGGFDQGLGGVGGMAPSTFAALTGGQAYGMGGDPPGLDGQMAAAMGGKGGNFGMAGMKRTAEEAFGGSSGSSFDGGGGFGGGGIKSKLCTNFAAGACQYYDKCTFAHGEHELGMPYKGGGGKGKGKMGKGKMGQMMAFLEMMGCKGGKGKGKGFQSETVKKTKLCQNFPLGQCQYGDKCSFAHGDHELGMIVQRTQTDLKTKICTRWQQGQCTKFGCTFAHGEHELGQKQYVDAPGAGGGGNGLKTKICRNWEAGSCTRAVCTFAHGEHELGTPQGAVELCNDFTCGKCEICLIANSGS